MAMRKQNRKSKNSNIGCFLLPDSHVGDKEYFSFWSKTGPFEDPNIAELFAMIEEAKRNTAVPGIPTQKMKTETVKDDQRLCVPMNGNEVSKNDCNAGYCERKTETIVGEQNLVMPEIPTKRMKRETIEEDQNLCVPLNDNEVAKNDGDAGYCKRKTETIVGEQNLVMPEIPAKRMKRETIEEDQNLCVPMNDKEIAKNVDDNANDDCCNRKTEQIIDHASPVLPVPKEQKSIDVVRTSDEKDQNDSIVNLKPDKKRPFSTAILKYFSVVSELNRDNCQKCLDYLSKFKTTNKLQKFFTVIDKEESPESKSQKGGILFKRESH